MTGATLIFLILSMESGSDIYIGTDVFLCHSRAIYGKVFSITLACSGVAGKYWKTESSEYFLAGLSLPKLSYIHQVGKNPSASAG
jgi:hypothetical protein